MVLNWLCFGLVVINGLRIDFASILCVCVFFFLSNDAITLYVVKMSNLNENVGLNLLRKEVALSLQFMVFGI